MTSWDDLFVPEAVKKALDELEFNEPTPIQRAVLPAAIKGRMDIMGAAETGSGKTLAFGIPMISGILKDIELEASDNNSTNNDDNDDSEGDEEEEDENEMSDQDENDSLEMETEDRLFDDDEFEDMSDQEVETGCVKVVNDVEFDFDDTDQDMYAPPIEVMNLIFDNKSKKKTNKKLRGLVLVPTRELAVQVKNHLEAVAKHTGLRIAAVMGGMAPQKQDRILGYGPEIVVATPGRLWDLIQSGNAFLSTIKDLKYFAIDETDRMVEKGHFEELHKILELINTNEGKKSKRQNFIFSATLSLVHEIPEHALKKKRKKKLTSKDKLQEVISLVGVKSRHKLVDITRKFGTVETLTETRIHSDITQKDIYLYYFTQMHPGRTLVFCNSIDCVRRLVNLFTILNCSPLGLHAQMHQKQRLKNLERFTSDSRGFLIATDVAARGLDIKDVEHVVHYQVPRTSESYVHRSGRTARSFKEGLSVILIDPSENKFYKNMCKTLNRDKDLPMFPVDHDVFRAIKERVKVARELDKLKLKLRKEDANESWWKKAAREADLEISEEDNSEDEGQSKSKQRSNLKNTINMKERELYQMLSLPILTREFSGKYPTKSGKLVMPKKANGKKRKLI